MPADLNPARSGRSRLGRWLREPLLHFIVAGIAVFAIHGVLHDAPAGQEQRRIEITADDQRQIQIAWRARWERAPSDDELRNLIEEQVKEEILYREALALGLEKGDTIIKRRLAQKMDFLAEDVAKLREPAAGEVEAWFATHRQRYAPPALATFHHLFFSADKRGARAEADAREALSALQVGVSKPGDAFMFKDEYAEQTPDQVVRVFGSKFTAGLFQEKPGAWRGPIESGFGWHLVWIEALAPGEPPAFETVAEQARADWLTEQRDQAKRALFESLRARYEVVVDAPAASDDRIAALDSR
jgi:peptidyl-prolyl cis-trans isomerase C